MRVLVACEFSGVVRDAFLDRGHDAFSCDLLPTESPIPDRHFQCDGGSVGVTYMKVPYIGTYEWLGLKPTRKEARYLNRRLQKLQPFLRQVDIYLFQNTRRVRKIIRRLRHK